MGSFFQPSGKLREKVVCICLLSSEHHLNLLTSPNMDICLLSGPVKETKTNKEEAYNDVGTMEALQRKGKLKVAWVKL